MARHIGFLNAAQTFVSFLRNLNTAARTYTFQDRDGTIADLNDILIGTTISVSSDTTLDSTAFGKLHLLSGTSVDYTVTLPTAVGNSGKTIAFKALNTLTKIVTIDGNGTETIDGDLTLLMTAGGILTIMSNGANWLIVNEQGSWIPWAPIHTGFSALGNIEGFYKKEGKTVTLLHYTLTTGTSNATTFTITNLPFPAKTTQLYPVSILNNNVGAMGRASFSAGSSTLTLQATLDGGAFTASGFKNTRFMLTYYRE